MKLLTRKTMAFAVAFLILAMAFSLVALPANAQPDVTLKTYPFIDAIPNPVGVNEDVLIRFGILQQLPSVAFGYEGLTVTVVRPDLTTETLGGTQGFTTDSTGGTYTLYTPNQVGTYKLTAHYPEQVWKWGTFFNFEGGNFIYDGTVMAASTSETIDLVVQQEPLPAYPGHPLPTEYWSRPIDPQLREWAAISGNWLSRPDNSLVENNDAPETAHILWAKPLTTGGLTGGYWDEVPASSETGDAYEGKFPGSVILNGILYYQRTDTRRETAPAIIAVDLRTGEEWLFRNNTVLSFGQILYFNSYNYDGVYTYIWDTTGSVPDDPLTVDVNEGYSYWAAYDPFTGNQQIKITNVPGSTRFVSAARAYGPSGEILIYLLDITNNWLALWNSTDCGLQNAVIGTPDYGSWGNTAHGNALGPGLNGTNPRCISWNVTIPAGLTYSTSFFAPILKIYPDRIVSVFFNRTYVRLWALKTGDLTKTSTTTTKIFDEPWNAPPEWLSGANTIQYASATNHVEKGVFTLWNKELRKHYGFSVETGKYMWQTDSEHFLDAYGWGNAEHTWYFAYGKYFSTGVGGILYAYDDQTGKVDWTYNLTDAYNEPVTGNRWWGWISLISDGKVYLGHLEHSAEQPIPRGAPFICLNATSGEEIWRVNGMFRQTRWGGNAVIGDSIIATMDTYDQRIYAIGKGPSAITLTAGPKVIVDGDSVMVEGMVTDISAGTKSDALTARFPNGVQVVADENMSDWMLYVYKQFECPTNVVGVEVVVEVLDPNNNFYEVGRTTSDASGFYKLMFTPEVPGEYTMIATFKGSKAYYGSYAKTAIGVVDAPVATPEPTPTPAPMTDAYVLGLGIAAIIAIVVIGLVIILMLRKR